MSRAHASLATSLRCHIRGRGRRRCRRCCIGRQVRQPCLYKYWVHSAVCGICSRRWYLLLYRGNRALVFVQKGRHRLQGKANCMLKAEARDLYPEAFRLLQSAANSRVWWHKTRSNEWWLVLGIAGAKTHVTHATGQPCLSFPHLGKYLGALGRYLSIQWPGINPSATAQRIAFAPMDIGSHYAER